VQNFTGFKIIRVCLTSYLTTSGAPISNLIVAFCAHFIARKSQKTAQRTLNQNFLTVQKPSWERFAPKNNEMVTDDVKNCKVWHYLETQWITGAANDFIKKFRKILCIKQKAMDGVSVQKHFFAVACCKWLVCLANEGVFIPAIHTLPSINNPVQVNYWQGHAGS